MLEILSIRVRSYTLKVNNCCNASSESLSQKQDGIAPCFTLLVKDFCSHPRSFITQHWKLKTKKHICPEKFLEILNSKPPTPPRYSAFHSDPNLTRQRRVLEALSN